jgi:hypothetical protein
MQYIPITYEQTSVLTRTIVFNGQSYTIGGSVTSTLDWNAYRFGYEFDFISRDRGFGGFVLDFKYTDVTATLATPISLEFTQAKAPIPAIGGIFRVYVVPNISITGELTGFKMPERVFKDAGGHYFDFNLYGTLNFTNYVGVQVGYRARPRLRDQTDTGSFTLREYSSGSWRATSHDVRASNGPHQRGTSFANRRSASRMVSSRLQ